MMTHNEERKIRIGVLHKSVQNCTLNYVDCNKEKLIAAMMCNHGLSKRIVIEYVNALIMQGLIKEEKGMLWATPNKSPTALQKEMNKVLAN